MDKNTTAPVLTASEQQLAALLKDASIPDSVKTVLAATFQRTIEMEKALAKAEADRVAAELKASKAKSLKDMIAAGPVVYVEAPGKSSKDKDYPAKVCVNPCKGAHPFYGQIKLTPNQWRELIASGIIQSKQITDACDECDKQYPVVNA